ncbi:terminase gpA endonuclease subunit [Tianweitania sediminis]|uniref:Phage terminase large subunit family protein n=1 Tax=Tianweitania sediminis TaxID=1502156 RepID=A0A8J7UJD4_9HYPH|nr:terminase gpA endonuclease subunit [Tianweitania sediminis]MBP0439908.1 phage terminase large subunit family protein [Tianweitania sediminis]
MRPQRDSSERHEVTASESLHRLFSEAPLPGLADPAAVEMAGFSVGYRPFERLPVSGWADEHRKLTGVGASEPGDWGTARTPYLREIMDNMSTVSPVWKQAFVAGAQIGKTEAGNCCIGYWISAAPGPIMMVLPKAGTAEKMSKQRITPMINSSPAIAEKVTANLLMSREFHGGVLFFASTQSATDLRAIPVRYLYCDEVDAFPIECEGEGPPMNLALARTRTFRNKRKVFLTSTPKSEATSAIWAAWQEGDVRLYHVPCPLPSCGAMITLELGGLKWDWGDHRSVRYGCPECKERFGEEHKTWMLERGEWRPTRKDLDQVPEGVRSYRLPSLYAPLGWHGWDEMVAKFEGIYSIPSKLAEFRNVDLGLPSVEVLERIDWETLMGRADVGVPYTSAKCRRESCS